MSTKRLSRYCAAALLAFAGTAMLATTFDAEARRMGGGGNAGRQSTNVMQQRAATPPAAAPTAGAQRSATAPAAATGAAAGAASRSTASRWFGPIAGIAAGLGIAALLSHLGLGAAFAEFLASALLIALVVFAVLFLIRRLRGGAARPAMQGAGQGGAFGGNNGGRDGQSQPAWRESLQPAAAAPAAAAAAAPVAAASAPTAGQDPTWFLPGADFDTPQFLKKSKEHFIEIQKVWDSGDTSRLQEYLTDDLIAELSPQLAQRDGTSQTEVVLLNAELLGVEKVSEGHLASVRYSGMLREEAGAEAFRFEEVWNLYKPDNGGWLLAGIQQIPVEYAS
ncbi:putative membrane protein [plant metagenome]|uniref:Putative membrane protein n=1 Tax=plant metagenome TaxID=1297885 RepID=A0A484SXH9_9ZZZZ